MNGSARVTLFPDGRAVFTGPMHDSGFPSYEYTLAFSIVSHKGAVFNIGHSGSLKGTLDPGSRSDDWTEGSTHSELAAAWAEERAKATLGPALLVSTGL